MNDENFTTKSKKPTREEHAERIDTCRLLLTARQPKHAIKRAMTERYGIGARTCERYLSRARAILLKELDGTPDGHKADAYLFYSSIISDKNESSRDRIKAQERIDKLLGLEGPIKFAQTDTQGNDITTPEQARARLDRILDTIRQRHGGEGDPAIGRTAADRGGSPSTNGSGTP